MISVAALPWLRKPSMGPVGPITRSTYSRGGSGRSSVWITGECLARRGGGTVRSVSASAIPLPDFAEDVGYGDSDELGRHVVDMAVRAGVTSEDRILDVGCGWGRVARVLTEV